MGDSKLKKYKTVFQKGSETIIEKKSRFLGVALPVANEEAATAVIEQIKKEHYNASHNVYAYRIGTTQVIERYSDDGEPNGTAGMPMLSVLKNEALTNILVVVTRYFGGTLLGTGGLVHAYQGAAKGAIDHAQIIEKIPMQQLSIITPYPLSGKIQHEILQNQHYIIDTVYTDLVEYSILVEQGLVKDFLEKIKDISSDQVQPVQGIQQYSASVKGAMILFENEG